MMRWKGARIGIATLGVVALLTTGFLRTTPIDAAWSDNELATPGAITAATLTAPVITSCTTNAGVLGGWSSITLRWTSPLDNGAQSVFFEDGALSMSGVTRTGPVSGLYTYTLSYTSTLLGGILGTLVGANAIVTVKNQYPNSQWERTSTPWRFTTTLLGLFPSCVLA